VTAREPDIAAVRAFVVEMGDHIRYRVAIEEPLAGPAGKDDGFMTKHWLEASYRRDVPTAFIVDRAGQIAWIGHPFELNEALATVIDGSWDLSGKAQAYREMLAKSKVRERFRLSQQLKAALAANDAAGAIGLIDDAVAVDPELQGEFGLLKLSFLAKHAESKSSALEYAANLMDVVGHNDIEMLLSVSVRLLETDSWSGPEETAIPDSDFAKLAVQAMRRVECLLAQDSPSDPMPPYVWMHLELHFARGLIAIGVVDEALEHARRAHRWGKEAGVSDDELAKIDALVKQFQGFL
jgi:hypothetical protein